MRKKRALISVSDKGGIIELAKALNTSDWDIISTGGTAKILRENGISVIDIAQITGFPEILNGRVKTLHPKIYGGLLAIPDDKIQKTEISNHQIELIDLVVVNLYPFKQTINQPETTIKKAIENIDIGGPSMIRAAAKNYLYLTVVVNPEYYPNLIEKILVGELPDENERIALAELAFQHISEYDQEISNYFRKLNYSKVKPEDDKKSLPEQINLQLKKVQIMRYGENDHQKAGLYKSNQSNQGFVNAINYQGKEMSFNNFADANAALKCVQEFKQPATVIVKHGNPCGVAQDQNIYQAYCKAFACDPISAFGGIIAFNREVNEQIAIAMIEQYVEVVLAPGYTNKALTILAKKVNLRVLQMPIANKFDSNFDIRSIDGGYLVQTCDQLLIKDQIQIVTKKSPDQLDILELNFANIVAKHVKSNAIVFSHNLQTMGIGAGQMSRIDSTNIAINKVKASGFDVNGSYVASDAFFPFRDVVDELAKVGAKAVIQPGGSIKDPEVISAADEHGLMMVFTNTRHFRH